MWVFLGGGGGGDHIVVCITCICRGLEVKLSIAKMTSVGNRGDSFCEDGLKKQWKWEWTSCKAKVRQERVGD